MHKNSVLYRAAAFLVFAAAPYSCLATETKVWDQSDQSDFTKGTPKNLSIRSDGRITLAPTFKELDSTNVPYLWAVVRDSKGTLYYAGGAPTGATTKIYELPVNGKPKAFAELTGLEIHALAVDHEDRLYAAVVPDAKIYRIDGNGKAQLFFDPKSKYVWAMAFDKGGDLFVATGDAGLIYKVTPDGKGAKFFDTEETHARSMIFDHDGNLIVGTEPSGLVMRITPAGQSFILYQTNKREVTSVAEHDGIIYAASVGNKTGTTAISGPAPVLPQTSVSPVTPAGTPHAGTPPPSLPPAVGSLAAAVTGGSEFYRIQKDGFAERIWSSPTDLIYAIAFDSNGRPLLGTGNRGLIYRVDSDQLSTQLLNAPPTQVTAFWQGSNNIVYAATGNVGNIYAIGPGMEDAGTLASDVLDAGEFSHWGKVHVNPPGTVAAALAGIGIETRSGNVSNPENNWSPWTKVDLSETGGAVQSPPARFLQYRLTLHCSPTGQSPEVSAVDIAYLPKNMAPKIGQVEIAPFNYRQSPSTSLLERNVSASGSPMTLTLPAVGQKRTSSLPSLESAGNATLQYSKGYVTVRWSASDPNSDPLVYKVEIRPRKDPGSWQLLKDKLQDRFYAFDTTAFPDGEYVVRVTANDSPSNTPSDALSSSLTSDPFTIDNTPPEITETAVTHSGTQRAIRFTAKDALSWIDKAEYSVNGGDWILLMPENFVTDSQVLTYVVPAAEGQRIAVRVFDEDDNVAVKQLQAR